MTASPLSSKDDADFSQLAPGVTISCRDEHWLVSNVARTTDGFRIRARGVSDYVRDTTAIVIVRPGPPQIRHTRL